MAIICDEAVKTNFNLTQPSHFVFDWENILLRNETLVNVLSRNLILAFIYTEKGFMQAPHKLKIAY